MVKWVEPLQELLWWETSRSIKSAWIQRRGNLWEMLMSLTKFLSRNAVWRSSGQRVVVHNPSQTLWRPYFLGAVVLRGVQLKGLHSVWGLPPFYRMAYRALHIVTVFIQLMAEILHQLRLVVYPIIYKVFYIPGGAGFQPSTVGFNVSISLFLFCSFLFFIQIHSVF